MYLDSTIVHRPSQLVLKNVKNSRRTRASKVKYSSSLGRSFSSSILSDANFSYSDVHLIHDLSSKKMYNLLYLKLKIANKALQNRKL